MRAAYSETFGESAVVEEGYGPVSVDVPAQSWEEALEVARDGLDCTFFDFLSAVDEWQPPPSNDTAADGPEAGVRIVCHLAHHWTTHRNSGVDHVVIRTLLSHETPTVGSVAHLFAGARWHERETHEMFGVEFTVDGIPLELEPLLLPTEFAGHPLRKDFVLASRVAKPFPGAKEPGESDADAPAHAAPSRRRTRPVGVPTPDEWGPRPAGGASQAPPSSTTGGAGDGADG